MAKKGTLLLVAGLAAVILSRKKRKRSDSEDEASMTSLSSPEPAEPAVDAKIIVFTARWCGVCKEVVPKIKEIEKARPEITFLYIDVDDGPEIAKKFGIEGVPTFVAQRNGVEVERRVGYRGDEVMEELIEAALGGKHVQALPDKVHLPVVEFGPDYMTGQIPASADYKASKPYMWMPIETRGMRIVVGARSCQYCAFVAEPKNNQGAYCTMWKTKVAHNYVCDEFEKRADL